HYARAIVEAARRRELVIACEELTAQALLGATESDELIDRQRSDLLRIGKIGRRITARATIDPAALQGSPIPERPWVCPGWIPDLHLTDISGSGGIGKSLLGQQLWTAAAIGASWIGQPVHQRRSLYFACEDSPDELHRRQADINQAYRC